MKFEQTSLGEFVDVQGGFAFKSGDLKPEGYCAVLKIKNVRDGYIDRNALTFVDKNIKAKAERFLCQEGDILISMTGSGPNAPDSMVGRVARVRKRDLPALINQRVGRILFKGENIVSPDFIYHCLSLKFSRNFLVSASTGSANQANISADTIKSLTVPKIPYQLSVEIGSFLSRLDDKIDQNKRMNRCLEELTRSLFMSWFVNFEPVRARADNRHTGLPTDIYELFPSNLLSDNIGEFPQGWERVCISSLTKFMSKGLSPNYVEDATLPIINQKCIRNAEINFDWCKFTKLKENIGVNFLEPFDILVNSMGVGTLGRTSLFVDYPKRVVADSLITVLRGHTVSDSLFLYQQLSTREDEIISLSNGSTGQTSLKIEDLGKLTVIKPPQNILDLYARSTKHLFLRKHQNWLASKLLEKIRDILAPALISGELRIPDAEKFLDGAGI